MPIWEEHLSLNLSLQPHKNSRWIKDYAFLKKIFKLFEENIEIYVDGLDVRNHKQVVKPRSYKRKY